MTDQVFVSYAREDEARIRALVALLEAQALSVFWDREIPPGKTWRESIGQALADARCVIVAWSHASVASDFVAEEADDARRRGVLVPVLIDPVLPPLGFRSVQAADLQDLGSAQPPANAGMLLDAVRAVLQPAAAGEQPAAVEQLGSAVSPGAVSRGAVGRRAVGNRVRARTPWLAAAAAAAVVVAGVAAWRSASGPSPPSPGPSAATPSAAARAPDAAATTDAKQPAAGAIAAPTAAQPPAAGGPIAAPTSRQPPAATAAAAGTDVQLLDLRRPEGGGIVLRVRVTVGGDAAQTVNARDAFALLRADGNALPPDDSRPIFDTVQPGASVTFELHFAAADGSALRTTLRDAAPVTTRLPAPARDAAAPAQQPPTSGAAVSRQPPAAPAPP